MYHVSAQGIDELMINVHYYYYYNRLGPVRVRGSTEVFIIIIITL